MEDMLDSFLGGLASAPVIVALFGVLVKISPGFTRRFSTWLYSRVDPELIPYGTEINKHWEKVETMEKTMSEMQSIISEQNNEIQKDIIKNTIINLIDRSGNHTAEVRYELGKLEKLHAQCWIMEQAEKYLDDPLGYYVRHHIKEAV